MTRTIARTLALGLALPLAQACSGARASGRTGGTAATQAPAASAPASEAPAAAPAPAPAFRTADAVAGTKLELRMRDSITSRTNHAGDRIRATALSAVVAARGDTVIPAGAEFVGTIREIAAAPTPHAKAHLVLAFTEVRIADALRPVQVRVTTMPTQLKGRGITGGTVAKVGGGALIGGIAGKLIGRSGTGTVIGAAAGAAAGGVYANATRDLDIVLPAGSVVQVALTAPFERQIAVK